MTEEDINKIEKDIYKYGLLQFRKYDDYLIRNLIESKITFSSPNNFNDPFDCNLPIDVDNTLHEYIDFIGYFPGPQEMPKEWVIKTGINLYKSKSRFKEDLKKILLDKRRFSCFNLAKRKQHLYNSLFWANYANKHQGICMKFSGDLLRYYYQNHKNQIQLVPVEYVKGLKIPEFNFIKNRISGETKSAAQYFFGTKSSQWSYEEEIRFICDTTENSDLQYVNYKFDTNSLREIYLGCKLTPEQENVLKWIFRLPKYKHVKLFKLHLDQTNFRLNPIELEKY